ncbi:MAG: phage terminase large subunit [Bacteroidota bacterium]
MNLKPTTALRKILYLTSRIWGIQGGQGAGKTISILWILCDYAWKNPDKEIFIASSELTKMRITVIKDFKKVMRSLGMFEKERFPGETLYRFPNGSFIKFIGLDKEDIGKGLRSDVMFINEANKINFETYRELTSRAKRVIIDFNPNSKFWYHKEVMKSEQCQHLVLTYKDNEFLSKEEVNEILSYKEKGFNPDGSEKNEYWANKWRIYGLGEIGGVEGRIFYWNSCSYLDYLKIQKPVHFYCDWGKSDPWAIGEFKYHDGRLFLHERNYRSENEIREVMTVQEQRNIGAVEGEGMVTWMFNKLAIPKDAYVVCDNNRPTKITAIRDMGWDYAFAALKGPGSINAGIDTLQDLEVFYTDTSENIEYEQENYQWAVDRFGETIDGKPVDTNNHHMDGARMGAAWLLEQGVIKAA